MGLKTIISSFFLFFRPKERTAHPQNAFDHFFNHHMAHAMIDFYKLSAFNFENPSFVLRISPQCDFKRLTAMS